MLGNLLLLLVWHLNKDNLVLLLRVKLDYLNLVLLNLEKLSSFLLLLLKIIILLLNIFALILKNVLKIICLLSGLLCVNSFISYLPSSSIIPLLTLILSLHVFFLDSQDTITCAYHTSSQ